MSHPLVSVIVPVYNVEAYLPHCLQAISEQTYRNLEILLVDDGSTDRSGQICDEFARQDTRARVIHQPNSGLWAARNTGHDAANGDYLFFPDADDYFNRDIIRLLLQAINSGSGFDLAICRVTRTERNNEDISSPEDVTTRIIGQDELFKNLFSESTEDPFSIFMWNKLFRSSSVVNFRSKDYQRSQDKDYMMRLFHYINKAILINNRLYYWVQRPGSLTHSRENMYLYNECRARMCYRNYMNMPTSGRKYSHYLLNELYTRLLFWRYQSIDTTERKKVFEECDRMIKDTHRAFLHCREVKYWKRISCLFLAYNPKLAYLLLKRMGN